MRFKDISGKEIIDLSTGSRLGVLGQTDLQIDVKTGQIEAFIIPNYSWFGLKKDDNQVTIGWDSITKIGEDIILIESVK